VARQVRRAKATGHPRRVNPVPQPAPDAGIATHSADASAERATLQGKAVGRATPSQAYVVRRRARASPDPNGSTDPTDPHLHALVARFGCRSRRARRANEAYSCTPRPTAFGRGCPAESAAQRRDAPKITPKNETARCVGKPTTGPLLSRGLRLPLHAATSASLLRCGILALAWIRPRAGGWTSLPSTPVSAARSATGSAPELFGASDGGQRPPPPGSSDIPSSVSPRHHRAVAPGNPRFRFIRGMTNAIVFDEPHLNRDG